MVFRKRNKIRLWWHLNDGIPNFGDILNPYLVKKISDKDVVYTPIKRFSFHKVYICIGSVLGIVNRNCIVWGAGIIDRSQGIGPAKFLAVRGPATGLKLEQLGYSDPKVYGDPALLLPLYYTAKTKNRKYKLGIIPHHVDYENVKNLIQDDSILVINLVNDDIEQVVDQICSCDNTISSSLHGIIVSHAYGIPSMWVEFSRKLYGDGVKFEDYFLSVGIKPYVPLDFSQHVPDIDSVINMMESLKSASTCQVNLNAMMEELLRVCPFKSP
jgi:hypothetical protein